MIKNIRQTYSSRANWAVAVRLLLTLAVALVLVVMPLRQAHSQATAVITFSNVAPHITSGVVDPGGTLAVFMNGSVTAGLNDAITRLDFMDGSVSKASKNFTPQLTTGTEMPIDTPRTLNSVAANLGEGVHQVSLKATTYWGKTASSAPFTITVTAAGTVNNAMWQGWTTTVPTTMVAGKTYAVSFAFKNNGSRPWVGTGTNAHKLGSQNPGDNTTWGMQRIAVPSTLPGEQWNFTFNVTAPTTPGNYNFQWRMLQEFVEWFGDSTPNVVVNVIGGLPTVSLTAPTSGSSYTISTGVKSVQITGSATAVSGATIRTMRVYDSGLLIYTGATNVASVNVARDIGYGTHTIKLEAEDSNGSFGSTSSTITINAPPPTAAFSSPATGSTFNLVSGTTVDVPVIANAVPASGVTITKLEVMKGATSLAFSASGAFNNVVKLGNGPHQLTLRATDSAGNVMQTTQAITVTVQSPPPVATLTAPLPGATYVATAATVSVTVTGTVTAVGGRTITKYELFDKDVSIATGSNGTVSVAKAFAPGEHVLRLRGTASDTQWADSAEVRFNVVGTTSGNLAQFVSQTVPASMRAGEPYDITVKMLNTGTTTWTAATNYRLGTQSPQDSRVWNPTPRAFLSTSVAPGQTAIFTVTVTAPQAPGTYPMQWQMVQEFVEWFGEQSPALQIPVAIGAGPTSTLSVSPTNVRVAGSASASLQFTGKGEEIGGKASKVELFQETNGLGWGLTPIHTTTGSTATLNYSRAVSVPAGIYRFKLRTTNATGVRTDSAPLLVNVTNSTILGSINGVRSDNLGNTQLIGWTCQTSVATALQYKLLLDAPTLETGGTLLTSGLANVATEVDGATVSTACKTPGHHFVVELNDYLSQYAGRALYVQAYAPGITAPLVLPCPDNSCTMPGPLRLTMTSPLHGDRMASPTPVFLRAQVSKGSGTYDEVAFNVNGEWIPATADTTPGAYYASKSGLAVSATPYTAYAKVRQGNTTLISMQNQFTVVAAGSNTVTLSSPTHGTTVQGNVAVPLAATATGSTVASVNFYAGGVLVGTGVNSGGTWTASWTPAVSGIYVVVARSFNGAGTQLTESGALTLVVEGAAATPGVLMPVNIDVPHLNNPDAGTLPGTLDVNGSGSATYSIPIEVPPGTAGVQPNLALNYSSSSHNGLLGLGWALSGLSSIHRCGKTIVQDGVNARINFSTEDRLCLDGQRLVLINKPVNDSNYWAGDAEYRTEIDSFSRIKPIAGGGFRLESQDGRIATYGVSATSLVQAIVKPINNGVGPQPSAKNGPQSWAIDTIVDRSGNHINFEYTQDLENGEHRPNWVRYGGSGKPTHAAVEFVYEGRKDAWKRYIDESRNDLRSRIAHIKTYVGSTASPDVTQAKVIVRDYTLNYEQSPTSGRSLLSSVSACARNPQSGQMECLPATSFDWGKPSKSPGFESKGIWNGPVLTTHKELFSSAGIAGVNHSDYFSFADFNGDGRADVLEKRVASPIPPDISTYEGKYREASNPKTPGTTQTSYRYFHNTGSGFTEYSYRLSTNEAFVVADIGDFNGDGAPDLLVSTTGGARICLSPLSNGGGLGAMITFTCDPNRPARAGNTSRYVPYVIDIMGDGLAAHYSPLDVDDNAELCVQFACGPAVNPPVGVLSKFEAGDDTHVDPIRTYLGFEQMVDFAGIGKSYDARWTEATFIRTVTNAGVTKPANYWTNLTPKINIIDFANPVAVNGTGAIAPYSYDYQPQLCQNAGCIPYEFTRPLQGASLSADFNGSGYSGVMFGFIKYQYDANWIPSYNRAETTLCLSTGRAIDCGIRAKYSGGQYANVLAVGDFVGDGHPAILVERMDQSDVRGPQRTGIIEMCRVYGDDTTGGSAGDTTMNCQPWGGRTLPISRAVPLNTAATKLEDQVYQMDLLGTGRPQLVYYTSGKFDGDVWQALDQWEVFAPIDVAAEGQALDRIHGVTNGLGATSTVEYVDGVPTGAVGRSGTSTLAYPERTTVTPGKIVKRLRVGNGHKADRTFAYTYQDSAVHLKGRGALGFATISKTDEQTGIVTTTKINQQWPLVGMVLSQTVVSNDTTLSATTNTLKNKDLKVSCGGTDFPFIEKSVVVRKDLDGSDLGTTTTDNVYNDCWGNLSQQTTTTTGGGKTFIATTANTYLNTPATWLLGLKTQVKASKTDPVSGTLTRTVKLDYNPTSGLLEKETVEPGTQIYELITEHVRNNAFGLVGQKIQTWYDPQAKMSKSRTVSDVTYDVNGRYPVIMRNAKSHSETRSYDPGTGAPRNLIGPNLLETTWTNDGFGRVGKETRADGNETRSYFKQCQADCPDDAAVVQIKETYHGGNRISTPQLAYSDNAGHVLRTQTWGFDGTVTMVEQRYDDQGRLSETDHPRFAGATSYLASRLGYDTLGRVKTTMTRDAAGTDQSTLTEYKGLMTTLTNARTHKRTDTRNVIGQVVQVVDAKLGVTKFEYEPFGNLGKTIDPKLNVITIGYDLLGRKTSLVDPDLGTVNYDVDPLGRTYGQSSAMQRKLSKPKTTMVYDELDRMITRDEYDLESHWVYDTSANGVGQLAEAYTQTSQRNYVRMHLYDSLSRPKEVQQKFYDGVYVAQTEYDAWGRLSRQTYRRGADVAKVFDSSYNGMGYLAQVNRGSLVLWTAIRQDAANRVREALLGNGLTQKREYYDYTGRLKSGTLATTAGSVRRLEESYQYDVLGSVSYRNHYWEVGDAANKFEEDFEYDELNRITKSTVRGQTAQVFDYDEVGSFKTKPGAGTYTYPAQGAGSIRPHAVKSTTVQGNFTYDDNGNLLTGAGRTSTWSSFDMPLVITKGSVTSTFAYGPEHQRTRQDRSDGTAVTYAGAQEVEIKSGQVVIKTYWPGGIGLEIDRVGTVTTATSELNWTHNDWLGSPVAISGEDGTLREKMAYDTWGKRRTLNGVPVGGTATPDTTDGKTDNRGYTGHEMLDQLDLVHMNGRVYDPLVGRFMSGDPLVQDPTNGQSYNRYAYVMNNPTNLTDPTGFNSQGEFVTGSHIDRYDSGAVGAVQMANGDINIYTKADADRVRASGEGVRDGKNSPGGVGGAVSTNNTDKIYTSTLKQDPLFPDRWIDTAREVKQSPNYADQNVGTMLQIASVGATGGLAASGVRAYRLYRWSQIARWNDRQAARNRADFEKYKDALRAEMEKPHTENPALSDLMDTLYRENATVGSGSTAAAVRQELETGMPVGGAFHSQKAQDSISALQRWLSKNPAASPGDRAAAENVIQDMSNALRGK
jgi:RHS repeat-associated protein